MKETEESYNEPNEPHDQWGRPLTLPSKKDSLIKKIGDVFFYTCMGLIFLVVFGWICIIFMPYFLGRSIWEKFENWQVGRQNDL